MDLVTPSFQETATGYAQLFTRGLLMVTLVSANTYQIAHRHYLGATIVGFLISWVWYTNARKAAHNDLPHGGIAYAAGAALGTLAGLVIMTAIWGGN